MMLEKGTLKMEYLRALPTSNPHKIHATRARWLMPKEHRKRVAHTMVFTPWCTFYDLTHHCWQTVQWREILTIKFRNRIYNYVEELQIEDIDTAFADQTE